jgi:hypothetical protein
MYAVATWAGSVKDCTANFDRIATLTPSAAMGVFVGAALILWWLGTRRDYGPYVPLTALISVSITLLAASVVPVASSVAIAATFLLNGNFRTFAFFCVGAFFISIAIVLTGSHSIITLLGDVVIGALSALLANLAFAGLILAALLRACDSSDRE